MVPDFGGVKSAELSPRAKKEGVHQQREVPDFGGVMSAELSPRAMRECINKERCLTLAGSKVQS